MKSIFFLILFSSITLTGFSQQKQKQSQPSGITLVVNVKGVMKIAPKIHINYLENDNVELFLLGKENMTCFSTEKQLSVTHKNGGPSNYIVRLGKMNLKNFEKFKENIEKNLARGMSGCESVLYGYDGVVYSPQ